MWKTNRKMTDINSTLSVNTLNVNALNISNKRQWLEEWKKSNYMLSIRDILDSKTQIDEK